MNRRGKMWPPVTCSRSKLLLHLFFLLLQLHPLDNLSSGSWPVVADAGPEWRSIQSPRNSVYIARYMGNIRQKAILCSATFPTTILLLKPSLPSAVMFTWDFRTQDFKGQARLQNMGMFKMFPKQQWFSVSDDLW